MNNKSLNTLGLVLKLGLAILGVIVTLLVWGIPNAEVTTKAEQMDWVNSWRMSTMMIFTISIIILTFVIILGFSLYSIITNPRKSIKTLIAMGAGIGLFLVFYFIGTSDTKQTLAIQVDGDVSKGTMNFTNAGLILLYIFMAIAIIVSLVAPLMGRYRTYNKKNV